MSVSDTSLERFRAIYEEQYEESLTDIELGRKAHLLLNFYLSIYGNPLIEKTNHNQSYDQ